MDFISRPYLNNGRAIGMVAVVYQSVHLSVCNDVIIKTQTGVYIYWYIVAARLVPHVYMGPSFIEDPAFICTFDKNSGV